MKKNLPVLIHLNMALIGGFAGGFAILNHNDLFGSAQTANMISLALDFGGRNDNLWLYRLLGVFVYIAGLASTVLIPKLFSNYHLKIISILVDVAAFIIVAFLPKDTNILLSLYPLFFAMAMQWCSFSGAEGYNSATIFSTNNLRQCITSFTEYFYSKDQKALHKGIFYGRVLLFFHIGVVISCIASFSFQSLGALIGILPTLPALGIVWLEEHERANIKELMTEKAKSA